MKEAGVGFDSWALVELMGHQRIAGKVTEAEIGGCKFVRVDVPAIEDRQPLTKYLGPSSIYAITPMDEETAILCARQCRPEQVETWSARELLKRDDEARAAKALPAGHREDLEELDVEDQDANDIDL